MTNQLATILGILIAGALLFDVVINGGASIVFLIQKLLELIEWVAFWR